MTRARRVGKIAVWMFSFAMGSVVTVVRRADSEAAARAASGTFVVSPDGCDDPAAGSAKKPFATVNYAAQQVPDGSTIVVRPGTYRGRLNLGRKYELGLVIRSEVPYQALLRNQATQVIRCYGCRGVTIEGFDIAHEGPGAAPIVVQIDGDGGKGGEDIVLRNNVLHDSYKNDILKINNGARRVLVSGNIFYNQASHDEHIDVNSVVDVVVEDNVFFNDYAGSGRIPPGDSASFIVIKDSNGDEDGILGAENITVRRNVFLGWQGGRAFGFVLVGEDGKPYFEARDVLVENNLFLGDSAEAMRSPFGVKGGERTIFRNNTVLGDLPGKAFATRINREGDNRKGETIRFYNNVWDDPTGTMAHFSDARPDDVGSFSMSHNLFWNGGASIPLSFSDAVNYTADRERVVANPGLPDPRGLVLPRWLPEKQRFADGSVAIEAVRSRLIDRYARPATARAVMDRADPRNAPVDDIRGRKRGDKPDIGAFEVGDAVPRAMVAGRRSP
jgi:hypothetical protein